MWLRHLAGNFHNTVLIWLAQEVDAHEREVHLAIGGPNCPLTFFLSLFVCKVSLAFHLILVSSQARGRYIKHLEVAFYYTK